MKTTSYLVNYDTKICLDLVKWHTPGTYGEIISRAIKASATNPFNGRMDKETKIFTLYLPKDTRETLRVMAATHNISIGAFVSGLVTSYYRLQEAHIAERKTLLSSLLPLVDATLHDLTTINCIMFNTTLGLKAINYSQKNLESVRTKIEAQIKDHDKLMDLLEETDYA